LEVHQLTSSWSTRRCYVGSAPLSSPAKLLMLPLLTRRRPTGIVDGNDFRFSCSQLSPMRGSAHSRNEHRVPHQWQLRVPQRLDLSPSISFRDRDQPESCVAALLKIPPVVNRISRRAIDFRPVQEAESRSTPLAEPRSQYSRESIFQVYRGGF
jgi:hypothetical protein